MSDIKAIKDLVPGEVMQRAIEGEQWCTRRDDEWVLPAYQNMSTFGATVEAGYEVAIIDTITPELPWDKFDWNFFNKWGGVPTNDDEYLTINPTGTTLKCVLRESELYYWAGGAQPVPDNVEVEVIYRDDKVDVGHAGAFQWTFAPEGAPYDDSLESRLGDIRGFKLTGRTS